MATRLIQYADWMVNNGRVITQKDGNWTQEPDYVKALELFRRFVERISKRARAAITTKRSRSDQSDHRPDT